MSSYFYLFLMCFISSSILTAILVWNLSRLKIKQVEREEGPASHKSKSGTPTMGGLGFVLVIAVYSALMVDLKYLPLVFLFAGFSLIGFFDDFIKVSKARNLGFTFWQKMSAQIIFASLFVCYLMSFTDHWQYAGLLSFLGIPLYILFSIFIIVGTSNAANLTDGLDGLLAGCSIMAFTAMSLICAKYGLFGGSAFSLVVVGALLGFIVFNFPRSKIFMGDTGSLGIGAMLAGLAILIHLELILVIIGGVFLAEALSVIMQVASYKLWKTRIFKMAPLHHHFELLGMSEIKVVLMFWSVQLVLSIIGVVIL